MPPMSDVTLLAEVAAFLRQPHGQFIAGEALPGNGPTLAVINPATGKAIAGVTSADVGQADRAMASASQAFASWRAMPTLQRGTLLLRLADLLASHREELAQLESLCSGKTIGLARMLELDQSVAFLRYFAGWAGKVTGETLDVSLPSMAGEQYTAFTRRQPVGVVVGIVPWNFSIMIAIWKLAAALVCGCTIVMKPSEYTPLTLLRVAELAKEAGIPDGVINVVNGAGGEIAQRLIAHPACAKVSFTGSVATGEKVQHAAIGAGKRVTLELGGKNAALFLDDLTPEAMADGIIEAGYLNQGQICAAAERFYLPQGKLDAVLEILKQRLSALRPGSPLDEQTLMGPLANRVQFEKVLQLIEKAREEGDTIVCGGEALPGDGYFVLPTAVKVRSENSTLMQEETFGPVCSFIGYQSEEEALSRINASPFGLAASVWSENIRKALRYSDAINAGIVWVNMHTFLDPAVPFGGMKGSGIGREFGSAFIDDYTELKSVMVRY
ncbi:aldehyde dehydrogenase family protein [Raoultella ornithinolytica]|uniref:aldehyde dehydrogenase family protein n=1 Tax=Raoultella ornithinolytica TaxID=54291 RepID=UPI0015E1022D|nr:aldehyde dehydrogenase family protein [Raoultella ornithinolytica]EKR9383126.1 aldehyde dehydrogenase family protein [Raoultella ornithinolytica]WLP20305.1 aldehyde dehydrogenase family protein [Raoultella ornithinolytica]HED3057531.1 aldehyde dehydrogenase family protein [Raoultella ornithinolytica]